MKTSSKIVAMFVTLVFAMFTSAAANAGDTNCSTIQVTDGHISATCQIAAAPVDEAQLEEEFDKAVSNMHEAIQESLVAVDKDQRGSWIELMANDPWPNADDINFHSVFKDTLVKEKETESM